MTVLPRTTAIDTTRTWSACASGSPTILPTRQKAPRANAWKVRAAQQVVLAQGSIESRRLRRQRPARSDAGWRSPQLPQPLRREGRRPARCRHVARFSVAGGVRPAPGRRCDTRSPSICAHRSPTTSWLAPRRWASRCWRAGRSPGQAGGRGSARRGQSVSRNGLSGLLHHRPRRSPDERRLDAERPPVLPYQGQARLERGRADVLAGESPGGQRLRRRRQRQFRPRSRAGGRAAAGRCGRGCAQQRRQRTGSMAR